MSSDILHLQKKLLAKSEEFKEKSTQLSNAIEDVENFFSQLPRIEKIVVEGTSIKLILDQATLFFSLGAKYYPVARAKIEVKSRIAELLPDLFKFALIELEDRVHLVDDALLKLSDIPISNSKNEEGK